MSRLPGRPHRIVAVIAFLLLSACSGYAYNNLLSPIPYDKPYEQLTAEQKQIVRSGYASLDADVEPPFPENGLQEFVKQVDGLGTPPRGFRARVVLEVDVDEAGGWTNARFEGTSNLTIRGALLRALAKTHFKPAKRNGVPIASSYFYSVTYN